MDAQGATVGGIVGGAGGSVLGCVTGMVNGGQMFEVATYAVVGAAVGWATQIILNKLFKHRFNNFLNKLNKPKPNGHSTGDMGKGHRGEPL